MFGFGKKRSKQTFKQRVSDFWVKYSEVADRYYQTIEEGNCASLAPEFGKFADKTLPGVSWVFGPGENGGHSLTLTGEGQILKQLMADYCCRRAPELAGWTFYASRQPSLYEDFKGFAIGIGDANIDVESFKLRTHVDDETEKVDIVAWHPAFERLPEEHRYTPLFILLDEALGEFGTQTWIGTIDIKPFEPDEQTRSLAGLPEFLKQVGEYHKWEKLPPLETLSVYKMDEQSSSPRGDTIVGTSVIPNVVFEYIENKGRLDENPLLEAGAELVYLVIDTTVFPEGQQADARGNLEALLSEALEADWSGRTLGGAFGVNNSYIEMILYDGEQSRRIVKDKLAELQLDGRYKIVSF